MNGLPRSLVVPIVLGIWAIMMLVGVYTLAILPSFTDYYDFYQTQTGFGHAYITIAFRHGYPFGAVLVLAAVIAGAWLLRGRESSPARLIWFAAVSLVVAGAWFVWAVIAERSIYVLSLPA